MKNFIKHYIWFIKTSKNFMEYNTWQFIIYGGLKKGIIFSKDMCKWDKLTTNQREYWYLTANRTMEF